MVDSILTSTKKTLGLEESYTAFDPDIILHINSIFMVLQQLGIGPANGFMIEDKNALWANFLETNSLRYNAVKTYMYLRVRILFDPPTTSYLITALQEQLRELEWRLSVQREELLWTDPNPILLP